MVLREEVEKLSLVLVEGEKSGVNIYESMKNSTEIKLKPECRDFIAKLLAWVCRDGTEFSQSELDRLGKLNLAYTDKDGKRRIVFIGCNAEYPDEVAATLDYMLYNGKILYRIVNEKIRFEAKDN